jgi:RHS repeat-associated protein
MVASGGYSRVTPIDGSLSEVSQLSAVPQLGFNVPAAATVLASRVQWDAENRLVGIVQASGTTGFVYDGAGHRVQETLNGNVIKQWVWCGSQPCEERDGSGNVTKRFYAQGEQIGGVPYYFTRDHLGSVREMTDGTGAIRARYDYDPYGRVTKISGDLSADFGFTGDHYHAATGLSLTMYREYDPNLGRWLSRDPLGTRGGLNLYSMVGNNPVNQIDRFGLLSVPIKGGFHPANGPWNTADTVALVGLALAPGAIIFGPEIIAAATGPTARIYLQAMLRLLNNYAEKEVPIPGEPPPEVVFDPAPIPKELPEPPIEPMEAPDPPAPTGPAALMLIPLWAASNDTQSSNSQGSQCASPSNNPMMDFDDTYLVSLGYEPLTYLDLDDD